MKILQGPKMTTQLAKSQVAVPLQPYASLAHEVNIEARAIKGKATKAQVCRFTQFIVPPQHSDSMTA